MTQEELENITDSPVEPKQRSTGKRGVFANLFTIVFILIALSIVGYFAFIVINPDSELNVLAVPTPLPIVITATPEPLDIRFALVEEGVRYLPADDLANCEGSWIAGQVNGADQVLKVQIVTNSQNFEVLTGTQIRYGSHGFELQVTEQLTEANYGLQLRTQDNVPVSESFLVTTQTDCESSIAFVEFIEVNEE